MDKGISLLHVFVTVALGDGALLRYKYSISWMSSKVFSVEQFWVDKSSLLVPQFGVGPGCGLSHQALLAGVVERVGLHVR